MMSNHIRQAYPACSGSRVQRAAGRTSDSCACRLAAEAAAGEDRTALQLRQAQQMALALARRKDEAAAKLDRLTEKKVACPSDKSNTTLT